MPHILIIKDDVDTHATLNELVGTGGFTTVSAGSPRDTHIQMPRHSPDAVLIGLILPDGNGIDLMEDISSHSGTEIIVIAGYASMETAVEALRTGAADCLVKPVNSQRLKSVLARIPRPDDLRMEISSLRGELRRLGLFGQVLGDSTAMQTLYDQVSHIAPTEATVLLIDESGTGKELAAQTIHDLSLRRKQSSLPINCGAVSPSLIKSEMFNHERGSFTGADHQHKGYFERANGDTLFLDGITEIPVELQVRLLHVLETGVFMCVDTNHEVDSGVRVIAATNRDPEEAVTDGKLHADLYHRLNVFPLQLPPLRERDKDVELLAQHFLDQLNAQSNTKKAFLPPAMETLCGYHWPGNVRGLRNHAQYAYILSDEADIDTAGVSLQVSSTQTSPGSTLTIPVGTSLAGTDKKIVLATPEQCGGVKGRAAELLGISLKALYSRLEEYGNSSAEDVGEGNNTSNGAGSGRAHATKTWPEFLVQYMAC